MLYSHLQTMRKETSFLLGTTAAAGVALGAIFGGYKAEASSQPDDRHPTINNSQDVNLKVVCIDPKGDQNPPWADILQVRKGETDAQLVYEFTFAGDITNNKSIVRPDIGFGVAQADENNKIQTIFGARGAEKTADTKVAVERLSEPVEISQGPATPFKVEEITWEGEGADFIESNGNVSTFSIPKDQINATGTEIYHTTEGTGHGNPPTQVHNKDICIPEAQVVPTPTAVVPPVSKPPEATPTQPPIISLPPTGGEPLKNNGLDKTILVSALGLAGATGAAFVSKLRSNKK